MRGGACDIFFDDFRIYHNLSLGGLIYLSLYFVGASITFYWLWRQRSIEDIQREEFEGSRAKKNYSIFPIFIPVLVYSVFSDVFYGIVLLFTTIEEDRPNSWGISALYASGLLRTIPLFAKVVVIIVQLCSVCMPALHVGGLGDSLVPVWMRHWCCHQRYIPSFPVGIIYLRLLLGSVFCDGPECCRCGRVSLAACCRNILLHMVYITQELSISPPCWYSVQSILGCISHVLYLGRYIV
jgi:hypothetical protein